MIHGVLSRSSPRYREWFDVFGTSIVPLSDYFPRTGTAPGLEGDAKFYRLAVHKLRPEQRQRLINHVSLKFALPADEVERDVDDPAHGVPILADDVLVSVDARLLF